MKGAKYSMHSDIQTKMVKLLTLDNLYRIFFIFSLIVIIHDQNYLDISYFLLITFQYIRIKIHRSRNS